MGRRGGRHPQVVRHHLSCLLLTRPCSSDTVRKLRSMIMDQEGRSAVVPSHFRNSAGKLQSSVGALTSAVEMLVKEKAAAQEVCLVLRPSAMTCRQKISRLTPIRQLERDLWILFHTQPVCDKPGCPALTPFADGDGGAGHPCTSAATINTTLFTLSVLCSSLRCEHTCTPPTDCRCCSPPVHSKTAFPCPQAAQTDLPP